ncbi:Gamma-tubulin complex component 6 [Trichinella britovi]|uniref:Gamma-tubulin complex component n=1 Tax=Trichinella britovi TaxID=45882 RepID=A0A0V1CAG1_TRIBR|nr:Gamma-tubulin complex component 6 [Trichinella britovi]
MTILSIKVDYVITDNRENENSTQTTFLIFDTFLREVHVQLMTNHSILITCNLTTSFNDKHQMVIVEENIPLLVARLRNCVASSQHAVSRRDRFVGFSVLLQPPDKHCNMLADLRTRTFQRKKEFFYRKCKTNAHRAEKFKRLFDELEGLIEDDDLKISIFAFLFSLDLNSKVVAEKFISFSMTVSDDSSCLQFQRKQPKFPIHFDEACGMHCSDLLFREDKLNEILSTINSTKKNLSNSPVTLTDLMQQNKHTENSSQMLSELSEKHLAIIQQDAMDYAYLWMNVGSKPSHPRILSLETFKYNITGLILGHETDFFRLNEASVKTRSTKFFMPLKICVEGIVWETFEMCLEQFLETGTSARCVSMLVHYESSLCRTMQSFQLALSTIYFTYVRDVQTVVRSGKDFAQIVTGFNHFFSFMRCLGNLCEEVLSRLEVCQTGKRAVGWLWNTLFEYCELTSGNSLYPNAFAHLLERSFIPLRNTVEFFWKDGIWWDNHDEFPLMKEIPIIQCDYGFETHFQDTMIVYDGLPNSFPASLEDPLSLLLDRHLDIFLLRNYSQKFQVEEWMKDNSAIMAKSDQMSNIFANFDIPQCLRVKNFLTENFIVEKLSQRDECLLDYFRQEAHIDNACALLKNVFLCGDAKAMGTLCDCLFPCISESVKPSSVLRPTVLLPILEESFDHLLKKFQPCSFTFQVVFIPEEFTLNDVRLFSCLKPCLYLNWPLRQLITEHVIQCFEHLWTFVMYIHFVRWMLHSAFSSFVHLDDKHLASNHQLHVYFFQLKNAINEILAFWMHRLINDCYSAFEQRSCKAQSLAQLRQAVVNFADDAFRICLLEESCLPDRQIINLLLVSVVKFCRSIQYGSYDLAIYYAKHAQLQMKKICTELIGTRKHLKDLDFSHLVLRINFNDFFSTGK